MLIKEENINYLDIIRNNAIISKNLFQVEIDVTAKCNANCFFCYQGNTHEKKNEITTNDILKLLKDLRQMGVYYIGFSGGEPFARNDFITILKYAKQLGFRVSLITNGQVISKKHIEILNELKINRITFSFHSINREIYNKHFGLHKESQMYDVSLSNIKYAIELGMSVGIAATITKYNVEEIGEFIDFYRELGLNRSDINLNLLLEGEQTIRSFRPTKEQLEKVSHHFETEIRDGFLCSAGIISCSIDSKGDVYPCTFFNTPVGNILNEKIQDIWNGSHYLKMLRSINETKFEKCTKCNVKETCNPCYVSNLNETDNIFVPSESFCLSQRHKLGGV